MNTGWKTILPWYMLNAGSFNPASISGLALWLDAADTSTITLDGSNNVSEWRDKSGNARHAAQATTLNRPAFLANQLNGFGAVKGNGSNQWIQVASFPSLADGYTIYAVSESSGATNSVILSIGITGFNNVAMIIGNDSVAGSYVSQFGAAVSQPAPTAGTNFSRMVKYDGSHPTGNYRIRLSTQVSDTTGTMTQNVGTPPTGTLQILRSNTTYMSRNAYEIMIFNRQTTTEEDVLIKAYIAAKWGLAWS